MANFRNILPPPVALWLFVLALFAITSLEILLCAFFPDVPVNPFGHPRSGLCTVAACGFGGYRAVWNHPLMRPGYLAWLSATPWRFPAPLPAGPPHWVWQDGAVIGLLIVLSLGVPVNELCWIPTGFALGYTALLCVATAATGVYWPVYANVFMLGLIIRLDLQGGAQLPSLGVVYLIGLSGLRRSLATCPWQDQFEDGEHRWHGATRMGPDARNRYMRKRAVGFPFSALAPSGTDLGLPYGHGFALAVTAAWLTVVGISVCDGATSTYEFIKPILIVGPATFALMRICVYCVQHWPPISLLGRIFTLRWIIPGYDRVFITPVATLASGYAVSILAWYGLLSYEVAAPMVVLVSGVVAFNGGPSLADWKLTGHHRMTADCAGLTDCKKV